MKNRVTAGLLALFLGWIGIHRFYLRQPGLGVLYIFFLFFGISFILGLIDALFFFLMSDEQFDLKYNKYIPENYSKIRDRHRVEKGPYSGRTKRRSIYGKSSKRKPILSRNPYKKEGIDKFRDFDYRGAVESFKKGLEISPEDPALHFNIACAFSLTEEKDLAFFHLDQAVQYGFKDYDRIKRHDAFAYLRVQKEFEAFEQAGYRLVEQKSLEPAKEDLLQDDALLSQLKKLADLRERGLISEKEFIEEKAKIER